MRKAILLACAGAMALSACSQATDEAYVEPADDAAATNMIAPVEPEPRPAAPARPSYERQSTSQGVPAPRMQVRPASPSSERIESIAPGSGRETPAPAIPAPTPPVIAEPIMPVARIAYAFNYALAIPKERGAQLMSEHEYKCVSAGPELCQIVSAQADWTSGRIGGHLELRGQPDWINRFRAGLALDASNSGGRMEEARTEGEDVTRGIDAAATGAETNATIASRILELQRLQGGTMAQRMQIERQLAELYRLRDEQEITLRELNSRVQSARLTIEYRETGMMAANSPTRPVGQALRSAFGISMGMAAALIVVGSLLAPIALVGGAIFWVISRRRRKALMPA